MTPTRWKCVVAYDGEKFAGWQSQARADGVQDVIEARLAKIFHPPSTTAKATAYGSHCIRTMAVPTMRRAEGM